MIAHVGTDVLAKYDADHLMCPALSTDSHLNGAVCLNGALRELAKPKFYFFGCSLKNHVGVVSC